MRITKDKSGNNFEEIKKAFQNIKSYYDFEIRVEKGLKSTKSEIINGKGYLIKKEWVDRWKEQINYDIIKNDYLIESKSDKETRDKLIYIFEEKKLKYIDLNNIKNKELNEKYKIEEFLKTNSLVLVSSEFISSFILNPHLNEINYYLYENTIEINLDFNKSLKFKSRDSVISSPNSNIITNYPQNSLSIEQNIDNIFVNDILIILLNIYLDEKEFFDRVENSKSNINKSISDYILINSDIISQFKKFFNYDMEIKKIVDLYKIKSISDINIYILDKIKKENKIHLRKISDLKKYFTKKFEVKKFFEMKVKSRSDIASYKEYIYPSEFRIIEKIWLKK